MQLAITKPLVFTGTLLEPYRNPNLNPNPTVAGVTLRTPCVHTVESMCQVAPIAVRSLGVPAPLQANSFTMDPGNGHCVETPIVAVSRP